MRRKSSRHYSIHLLHSLAGVKLTLILTLVLFSGTLAVFGNEIDWLLYDEMRVTPQQERLNPGQLIDNARAAWPDAGLATLLTNADRPYQAAQIMLMPPEGGFRFGWIDPYSGEIRGDTPYLTVGSFLTFLHSTLYLPVIGRALVNALGLFCLISVVTGLLTCPGIWKRAFRLPRTGNRRLFLSDLHQLIGLWSVWFLLIMGATGTWWFYQNPLQKELGAPALLNDTPVLPAISSQELAAIGPETPQRLSHAGIVAQAKQHVPELQISLIKPAEHNSQAYRIQGHMDEWFTRGYSNRVYINPFTGTVMAMDLVRDWSFEQRLATAIAPLHNGNWARGTDYALAVKLIWLLFGLLLTALAISGLLINIRRSRRLARIQWARSRWKRGLQRSWYYARPWGGPMGLMKYPNLLLLLGTLCGICIALTLNGEGTVSSGYHYSGQQLARWPVSINAIAGLLEKELPPVRPGKEATYYVQLSDEAIRSFRYISLEIGDARGHGRETIPVTGPPGLQMATITAPSPLPEHARLWLYAEGWDNRQYRLSWPLQPDNEQTFDLR